ncbi:MAG: hypothetical protein V4496_00845 [Pseudomonadota bacterium]
MQPVATSNPLFPRELSATEMLAILNALDYQMKKAERDSSILKETSIYADLMMGMFIGCTALAMLALSSLAIPAALLYWTLNIAWNGVDLSAASDSVKALASEDKRTRQATQISLGSIGLMAAATAWSATEVVLNGWQVPTMMASGTATVAGSAIFTGGLSFAIAMFACGYQSHVAMKKAENRSTYAGLINEKNSLINEKEKKKTNLKNKIDQLQSLENKNKARTPIASKSNTHLSQLSRIEKLEKQIENISHEISVLKEIESMQCHFSKTDDQKSDIKPHKILTIDLMMAEQRNIAAAKRLDKTAYMLAGVGAGLIAASMLFPPLAVPGLILCSAAALIKSYQLAEKHGYVNSTINQTSRNEREQVLLATAKGVENKSFENAQEKLLQDYCDRRNLQKEQLASHERDKAIDLQCKHQYAKESKTWSGFLNHQWQRVKIVKSRFFTAKRPEKHTPSEAAPDTAHC